MKHLTQFQVSEWSGGKTIQIAIAPEGAVYPGRDFLWRVSSATVELDESDFTPLPDYERWIMPLRGEMTLSHDGGTPVKLGAYEVHRFDGADKTHSWGRCTDFNLMLRKGRCSGEIFALREDIDLDTQGDALILYCAVGTALVEAPDGQVTLRDGEAVQIAPDKSSGAKIKLSFKEQGCVAAARMRELR